MTNRVWIEFERPRDDEHAREICLKANRMMRRLYEGDPPQTFGWDARRKQFTYGDAMGYIGLTDRGEWFNLDYLGRN